MNLKIIKNQRINQNISQEKMAKLLNYKNRSSYIRLENGTCKLTLDKLIQICKILNLDTKTVIGEVLRDDK